ncbi:hypothetical protein GOP47_0026160 [Adiantum capillus-veneris]|uniref:GUN4-like domain-containing protein n=1 Tax=Adiantum capillus-veneris TaxID=13818 RepID=A0A9D4U1E1_ADICA|nr:hypothetical protein GOP47_0026160 [Adiantum capillus-veneris]
MATLRTSAFKSLESLPKASANPPFETPRKVASLSAFRKPRHSFALTWSARLAFADGNGRVQLAAAAATSSVEVSLESDLGISYEKLQKLLANCEWELADEETRRLIILLAGESAVKRKYVFFSEVQFMPKADLQTIDRIWRTYSQNKFGYSVQRKIMKRVDGDCTAFFKKVSWMKPLGSDTLQYTYRSFPSEFMWELAPSTPEGHLPLTNALRGTQLLRSLLDHPAFEFADDDLQVPSASSSSGPLNGSPSRTQPQQQPPKKPLSINYSF